MDNDDYLRSLGKRQNYNINVDHGQTSEYIDHLFTGDLMGKRSDLADGTFRYEEFRTLNNIVGEFYISPRYLERVAMHIAKNFLATELQISLPLIMGIWGGKGQGKSFQLELALKKMGIEPIIVSAGELEHESAGYPAWLMRARYSRAAEMAKTRGCLTCLVIQDVDAGLGRFENTQVTVNNQMVVGTLMNLCDNPAFVSIGETWDKTTTAATKRENRIPIIVTGNDLSTCFAPLLRDGRMDKFYWQPTREDTIMTVWTMFKDDQLSREDMETLIDTFPNQSLDFFGSVRQATYDVVLQEWILGKCRTNLDDPTTEDLRKLHGILVKKASAKRGGADDWSLDLTDLGGRERVLTEAERKEEEEKAAAERIRGFQIPDPDITLDRLLEQGRRLVAEQDFVNNIQLGKDYMKNSGKKIQGSLVGFRG